MCWDDPFARARLALALSLADPGLGGLHLKARAGPVRDRLLALVPGAVRLHPGMDDAALYGGLDWAATLAAGRPVMRAGLLDGPGPFVLAMAERATAGFAARLAARLEADPRPLILLDEGAAPDEDAPAILAERLAFRVDLGAVPLAAAVGRLPALAPCAVDGASREALTVAAARLGIASLRAPSLAVRAAGLLGHEDDPVALAAALVLAHRATVLPEPPEAEPPDAPPPPERESDPEAVTLPEDLLLAAVRALLPDDLLARMTAQAARTARGSGSGAPLKGNRRGRPLPARAGRPSDAARIDLVATLRAAAPWQTIRRKETGRRGLQIRRADLRLKRFAVQSDRLLIFTVDASGSAALARLAEAKGAVELLLAQAYARRDHVTLIAFRQTGAAQLLPPTRSLVQTKRRLAGLPGGGGTPLAAGLDLAREQAAQARRRGMWPTICLLTDGRANIARDGTADRAQAARDAENAAKALRAEGHEVLVIDTGQRPSQALRTLAQVLDAPYLPLPRADAERMAAAVSDALATP